MININLEHCRKNLAIINKMKFKSIKELSDYLNSKINEHITNYNTNLDENENLLIKNYSKMMKDIMKHTHFYNEYMKDIKKNIQKPIDKEMTKISNVIKACNVKKYSELRNTLLKMNNNKLYDYANINKTTIINMFNLK